MTWDVEVHEAGTYEVAIYYTCPEADAGSTIELSFKSAKLALTQPRNSIADELNAQCCSTFGTLASGTTDI